MIRFEVFSLLFALLSPGISALRYLLHYSHLHLAHNHPLGTIFAPTELCYRGLSHFQ